MCSQIAYIQYHNCAYQWTQSNGNNAIANISEWIRDIFTEMVRIECFCDRNGQIPVCGWDCNLDVYYAIYAGWKCIDEIIVCLLVSLCVCPKYAFQDEKGFCETIGWGQKHSQRGEEVERSSGAMWVCEQFPISSYGCESPLPSFLSSCSAIRCMSCCMGVVRLI